MWWHTVTHGTGSERETGEWSGWPVLFTLTRNMVYPALLPMMRTPRLPVVDWTDAPRRLKRTRPFRRKTKSGFWACAITFQPAYTYFWRRFEGNTLLKNSTFCSRITSRRRLNYKLKPRHHRELGNILSRIKPSWQLINQLSGKAYNEWKCFNEVPHK